MPGPHVLFANDLTGEGLLFEGPDRLLVAWTPEQLVGVLADAAAAQAGGRWIAGYFSYEAGFLLEDKLRAWLPERRRTPLACLGVFAGPSAPAAAARLLRSPPGDAAITAATPAWSPEQYRRRFERLRGHLKAGDCYQGNLTFPIRARHSGDALSLFNRLRRRQPVAYGALVALEGPTIVSRSPELFFRVSRAGVIESLPMKGTAPRGTDPGKDRALKRDLAADPKNRSENVMIVDLLRNDLSHVCEAGSVEVPLLFHVDTYATLHQMISHVRGRLSPGIGLRQILAALFPCGSITGAPKIRAMQILSELEDGARDAYCGAIGWAAPTGAMEFNVAIRTITLHEGGEAVFNVGGGVVFDSTAEAEYEECLLKARFATLPGTVSV
jgi:para-aminobenzoate synthetase component I